MEKDRNILEESKSRENPFKVPEGYFETLAGKVEKRRDAEGSPRFTTRLKPYLAIAASFAIIAVIGTAVLKMTVGDKHEDGLTTAEYYSESISGQDISEEDIINYLLYAGFSAEELNGLSEE